MDPRSRGPVHNTGLRGRASECARLDDLVAAIRRGESRSLVLHGEAGIGKTALLEYLVASASDLTVVRAVGAESEMELAFASLHQLCRPLLGGLERLPAPQREALEIAFGLSDGGPPDRLLIGLAVLTLLSQTEGERPLLCVVDDAQWLDEASAFALTFVTRRLSAEPVGLVFAAREARPELRELADLEVQGVRNGDARALLSSALQFKLDDRVRDRIIEETRGNPLALLELPHGLTATQLAGGFGVLGDQALTGPLEESFIKRLKSVSDDTRRLLLIAAAEPLGDPLLLWRAADSLGIDPSAADAAAASGLLTAADRVTFRHPLVRSAVYRSADAKDRRAVHLALAHATDRDVDPDRRAWHLAAAAARRDEGVAQELERSAGRAHARGGPAATAAFLRRAVELSVEPGPRAERALAAAEASLQAGALDEVLGVLGTAEAGPLDEFQQARVDLVRAHAAFASGLGVDAPPLLLTAARQLEAHDLDLARVTYLTAWAAAGMSGSIDGRDVLLEICRAIERLPPTPGDQRPLDLLVDGLARMVTDGHADAAPILQRAAKELSGIPVEDVLRWGHFAASASVAIWDYEGMHEICARHVQLARDAGALTVLSFHVNQLGMACLWLGDFAGAEMLVAEEASVAAATGSPIAPYTMLRLRALQGREAEASAAIRHAVDEIGPEGQGMAAAYAQWAAAVLYNGLARYDEAAEAAQQAAVDTVYPIPSMYALPDLVEAAARGGRVEPAREALERLVAMTRPCGNDAALGIEARCRALLSDGEAAEQLFGEAIARLGRTRLRPDLARAHLLYGEWLRREGRRLDGREQLRIAEHQCSKIGMEAFAERARSELHASGGVARKRTAETRDDLTPQERQIARLARDGLSNTQIATRLFLSPRTVEWHLHKVFTKLDINSRHQLAGALPAGNPQSPRPDRRPD